MAFRYFVRLQTKYLKKPFDPFTQAPPELARSLVRVEGIEPSASVLSGQRSTTELHSQILLLGSGICSTGATLASKRGFKPAFIFLKTTCNLTQK